MCVCYFNVSITLLFNICKIILDSVFFYTDGVTKLFSRIVDLKKKKSEIKDGEVLLLGDLVKYKTISENV